MRGGFFSRMTIPGFLKLTRPRSNVKTVAVLILVFYLSGSQDWATLILVFLSLSLVCMAMYAFNSATDLTLDQKSKHKAEYSQAVSQIGTKKAYLIAGLCLASGLGLGLLLNYKAWLILVFLAATAWFYSSPFWRWKEKIGLDLLGGAILTFAWRFLAGWLALTNEPIPWWPLLGLVLLKTSGYLLYKNLDREALIANKVKNTVTAFSAKQIKWLAGSAGVGGALLLLSAFPLKILWLIPATLPIWPILYYYEKGRLKIKQSQLRILGFTYFLLLIISAYFFLL